MIIDNLKQAMLAAETAVSEAIDYDDLDSRWKIWVNTIDAYRNEVAKTGAIYEQPNDDEIKKLQKIADIARKATDPNVSVRIRHPYYRDLVQLLWYADDMVQ